MKTHLLILGFLLMLGAAHAQTVISQSKQAAPMVNGSGVLYLQGSASPVSADSKSATKEVVTISSQPESQAVILTGTAQPWDPNAKPAEKKIIVNGTEPEKRVTKQVTAGAIEEKND